MLLRIDRRLIHQPSSQHATVTGIQNITETYHLTVEGCVLECLVCDYSDRALAAQPSYLTHYIIVRADLPKGVQAAQMVHAAGESSPGNLPEGTYAVVLSVPSEEALVCIADKLVAAGIQHRMIREPTLPYDNAAMAIGIEPVFDRKEVRKLTSSLPLLR